MANKNSESTRSGIIGLRARMPYDVYCVTCYIQIVSVACVMCVVYCELAHITIIPVSTRHIRQSKIPTRDGDDQLRRLSGFRESGITGGGAVAMFVVVPAVRYPATFGAINKKSQSNNP